MDVELLVVPDCANEAAALDLLIRTLSDLGLADVEIGSQELAAGLGFVGSPTFLTNGRDPFGEPDRDPGLACRVYRSPEGTLSGLPDIRERGQSLKHAATQPHSLMIQQGEPLSAAGPVRATRPIFRHGDRASGMETVIEHAAPYSATPSARSRAKRTPPGPDGRGESFDLGLSR
jgi:hypothetical protein